MVKEEWGRWGAIVMALICGTLAQMFAQQVIPNIPQPILAAPFFIVGAVLLVLATDRSRL